MKRTLLAAIIAIAGFATIGSASAQTTVVPGAAPAVAVAAPINPSARVFDPILRGYRTALLKRAGMNPGAGCTIALLTHNPFTLRPIATRTPSGVIVPGAEYIVCR